MRHTFVIINALTAFMLLLALVLTCILPLKYEGSTLLGISEFTPEWRYTDASSADPSDLRFNDDGKSVIIAAINGSSLDGRSLCFSSGDVVFNVYLNDKKIYDFHPELGGLYGKSYGEQIHTVPLPSSGQNSKIKIICNRLRSTHNTGFKDFCLSDGRSYQTQLLRQGFGKFILCILSFSIGLVMFLFGVVELFLQRTETLEPMSLGVMAMVLAVWTCFPTLTPQLLSGNFASAHAFEHMTLMILPIPVLIFVGVITNQIKSPLVITTVSLAMLNTIVQCSLVHTGQRDYSEMLLFSHGTIFLGIATVIFLVARSIHRKALSRMQHGFVVSSLFILCSSGVADMIRFYLGFREDAAFAVRIGMVVFIVILAIYEFRQLIWIQVRSSEVDVMQRLAMEDPLTGLQNRTAFNKYEQEIAARNNGTCLFIHLDVNYLKKVNDTYGHAQGDIHIKAAADVIRDSFGQYGNVYRVGGDEFFAILDGEDCHQDYIRAVSQFRVKQRQYNEQNNPPVPLQLAHGMAEYKFTEHNPEKAEKLADERMYENKRTLKLANAS